MELYIHPRPILAGRNVLFAFQKDSLRTKTATQVAINKLGGNVVHVDEKAFFGADKGDPFGPREALKDTVKNVSQWVDAIFARVYSTNTLLQIKEYASIPVVNALCDYHHPMQALADFLTIQEVFGRHARPVICFIGDANNVSRSLIQCGLLLGYPMRFCSPPAYVFSAQDLADFARLALASNTTFIADTDPRSFISTVQVVYADTFVSMGEEGSYNEKMAHFKDFQCNAELMAASNNAKFMHCLPAHRGCEVTDEVIDSADSLVYLQAKNRMVSSMGVFSMMVEDL